MYTNQQPRIAILIPAYNEEVVIEGTVASLLVAGCSKEHIYVVDDKSTDETAKIARGTGVNVYTVDENGGKANAQRKALQYFLLLQRYDWIIFMDGDTKVDKTFYKALLESIEDDPTVGLYVGQVKSVKNNHIFSAARAFDYTYSHDVAKHGQSNFNVVYVSPGCTSMYKSEVLAKLEIDHKTLAEDMDLTIQVHRAKYKVKYVPGAIVHTQDPSTFEGYHKQTIRWYRGFWQVVKKHRTFGFTKKQPVDFYMMLLIADALIFNRVLWLGILAATMPLVLPKLMLIDFGCCALIAFYTAFRTKRLDVIYKLPVYYWLSYVNFYAYMRAFVEIIVCKKELLAWNKVKRYDFDSHTLNHKGN
jgi:cellulose synthase/poly-beta-1,6-N-acetylglucosamine synthase-like glycosyltransferase